MDIKSTLESLQRSYEKVTADLGALSQRLSLETLNLQVAQGQVEATKAAVRKTENQVLALMGAIEALQSITSAESKPEEQA